MSETWIPQNFVHLFIIMLRGTSAVMPAMSILLIHEWLRKVVNFKDKEISLTFSFPLFGLASARAPEKILQSCLRLSMMFSIEGECNGMAMVPISENQPSLQWFSTIVNHWAIDGMVRSVVQVWYDAWSWNDEKDDCDTRRYLRLLRGCSQHWPDLALQMQKNNFIVIWKAPKMGFFGFFPGVGGGRGGLFGFRIPTTLFRLHTMHSPIETPKS